MHEEHVQAFLRTAEAINRLDAEAAQRAVHPEAIFEPLRAATEGAFIGCEGVRRFVTDTAQTFDRFEVSYTDFRDIDETRFLASGTIAMRGRQSGVESSVATAAIVEVRDGLLWRYKDYGDVRLALAAAAD